MNRKPPKPPREELSYAIGVAEPIAITVDHFGTSSQQLVDIVRRNFNLRPRWIVKDLNL